MSLRHSFITLITVAGILMSVISCVPAGNATKQVAADCTASVVVSRLYIDFGAVKQGEELGATIWVKNIGQCAWGIKNIDYGCGCTLIKFEPKPLSPGDSVALTLFFDTSGFSGSQIKAVTIFDNSAIGKQELIVSAIVQSFN